MTYKEEKLLKYINLLKERLSWISELPEEKITSDFYESELKKIVLELQQITEEQ